MQGTRRVFGAMTRRALVSGLATLGLSAPFSVARTPSQVASRPPGAAQDRPAAADRLRELLSLVPASALFGGRAADKLFDWVDYRTHFEALGVDDPYAHPDDIPFQVRPLETSDPMLAHVLEPGIAERAGFRTLDVHQVLVTGVLPEQLTVYRGGFSSGDVISHLESVGYARKSGDRGDYWTIGEEGEIDFRDDFQRAVGNRLHNVAVLDDETMVYAPKAAYLEPVLALASAQVRAAAEDIYLAALLDVLPGDTVTVMAMPGLAFVGETMLPIEFGSHGLPDLDEILGASDEAVGEMPPILMSLSGATAGALDRGAGATAGTRSPEAFAFMTVLAGSEDDARRVATVAFWRLENMISPIYDDPYSERFVPVNAPEDAVDGVTVSIRFEGEAVNNALWASMIASNDVWPFAWSMPS